MSFDVFDIAASQWLINDITRVVDDAILGLVKCNPHLAILDKGRVVLRRDHLGLDKVKIISGGASGHEPAFTGFVGEGMLTAAVQGNIYSAPTSVLVLRTIKELARRHEHGILIIIGNNLGDRLNFGLAKERAKNIPNLKIKMLEISDQCNFSSEQRGLVGTLVVQKIAGAMAEANCDLYEIYEYCQEVVKNMATIVVTVKPPESPYIEVSACTQLPQPKIIDFGTGLHGETGYLRIPLQSASDTVSLLLQQITDKNLSGSTTLEENIPVVVFINNLGNSSKLEELIFVNEIVSQLSLQKIPIAKLYCGSLLTSLEMAGFSVTILKVVPEKLLEYLSAPCSAPYWNFSIESKGDWLLDLYLSTDLPPKEIRLKPDRGPKVSDAEAGIIQNALSFACGALISCEKQLNIIDSEVGDSDTGTNIKKGAVKISDYLSRGLLKIHWPFMLFQEISKILETHSDGLQCCLYAIMFEAAAKQFSRLKETDPLTLNLWSSALNSAIDAFSRYSKASLGKNTMYDSLNAAMEGFKKGLEIGMGPLDTVGMAAEAAEEAASKTRRLNLRHPDPGAHAVGIWMRAVYEALKLHI